MRDFTGRDEMLVRVDKKLWRDRSAIAVHDSGEVALALHGLGGVGKTVLAKQYAWENREKYYGIWWIRGNKRATLIDDLVALGTRLIPGLGSREPEEMAFVTLDQMAQMQTGRPWLLIYDNVEDQASIRKLTPADNAHVFITTRLKQWQGTADELQVDVFDRESAIDYLTSESHDKVRDRESAEKLAEALGRLPLALSHARTYCAARNWPFDRYLARLPELIRQKPKDADYPDAVFATFNLAITKATEDCEDAEHLMGVLAFLAPDHVPSRLFAKGFLSQDQLDDALAAFSAASLATLENLPDDTTGVSVQRLVQEVMRGRLSEAGGSPKIAAEATRLVEAGYDNSESFEASRKNSHLLPHALAVLAHAPQEGIAARDTVSLLLQIGNLRRSRGEFSAALTSYRTGQQIAHRLAKSDPGNANWQLALSIAHNSIGDVLVEQGDGRGALDSYQASLAIRDRLAKADTENVKRQRDLSVSQEKVADVLWAQGNYPAALDIYRTVLTTRGRIAKARPGNNEAKRDLSVAHSKIGDVLVEQCDFAAALDSYQASYAILDSLVKVDDGNAAWQRDLSVSQEKIGDVLVEQGKLAAALDQYRASYDILDRLAKEDPGNVEWKRDLAMSHGKIAAVLTRQGQRARALAGFQQGRKIIARLRELSPDNAALPNDLDWFDLQIRLVQ